MTDETRQHEAPSNHAASRVLVSVVIPAFRAERWVYSALESVAEQSLDRADVEVIVVDDASTDATALKAKEALAELSLEGAVIQRAQNGGVSAPRNTGWLEARGEVDSVPRRRRQSGARKADYSTGGCAQRACPLCSCLLLVAAVESESRRQRLGSIGPRSRLVVR